MNWIDYTERYIRLCTSTNKKSLVTNCRLNYNTFDIQFPKMSRCFCYAILVITDFEVFIQWTYVDIEKILTSIYTHVYVLHYGFIHNKLTLVC